MSDNNSYVWYVGYGSNLSKQRFLCYIEGGKPKYGQKNNDGCTGKTAPKEDSPFQIPYSLYFALPDNKKQTENWGPGGVAFINPIKEKEENKWSWGRMWKITKEQYNEVRDQEGEGWREGRGWYNHEIPLGEKNGIPIFTITNKKNLSNVLPPSDTYLKTMVLGLKETYNLTDEKIAEYLMTKNGIKGNFTKSELIKIIQLTTK
jgi:hypothetical protein